MGRGSGATLALRLRSQIYTLYKVKTLEAYPILPRPRGLHTGGCARVHPQEKSNTKASHGPSDNLAKSPVKSKPDGQPLEEYPYSSTVSGPTVRYHN
jgi:hypothetical protein